MLISVAICTRNRAESVRDTLHSISQMNVPPNFEWELILVDNSSTDGTPKVVHEAGASAGLPLSYIVEPKPGLANARNRAVATAQGTYIVFTDDDVRVSINWLAAYREAILLWPDAVIFGGPVRPLFEGTPPPWLESGLPAISSAFALRDFGPEPRSLGPNLPFGANMMIRMEEQRQFAYDPQLGAGSSTGLYGEETEVLQAILAGGKEGRWIPEAAVDHVIPESRQTVRYVSEYYERYGRSTVYLERTRPSAKLSGAATGEITPGLGPMHSAIRAGVLVAELLISHAKYAWKRAFAPPVVWCAALVKAARSRGRIKQRLRMRRS